jgi:hypothetical protein
MYVLSAAIVQPTCSTLAPSTSKKSWVVMDWHLHSPIDCKAKASKLK